MDPQNDEACEDVLILKIRRFGRSTEEAKHRSALQASRALLAAFGDSFELYDYDTGVRCVFDASADNAP